MALIAGVTSNTVPWEILRAGGYSPRLLEEEPGPSPYADRFLEDVFEERIRVIFDRLCAAAWPEISLLVIPRTSEQEHKLYLYLREMERSFSTKLPKLYLYNLLHTRQPESYAYGLDRTREMAREFGATDEQLQEAIAESNRARDAVRQLHQLRREGKCEGSAALRLIRDFYVCDRSIFADSMEQTLAAMAANRSVNRPRVLIKGAPLGHGALHALVEQSGGYVIGEDDWRGSRAAGEQNVRADGDAVTAIFEKYYFDEQSPRMHPPENADAWFTKTLASGHVDGVIFYEPLADDVAGWSYPRQAAAVDNRGIPSMMIREDGRNPGQPLRDQLGEFIGRCSQG
jgi:benzoyl-CoA reductase/2-hydroxyglutaryl-CoA dehydratase subunit BcrC/BadD/HgdB